MSELSSKITHTLGFLSELPRRVNEFYKICDEGMKNIDKVTSHLDSTDDSIRDIKAQLNKKYDLFMEKFLVELTIFNSDVTEITINRNDPNVVYTLSRFIGYKQNLKETKKRLKKFIIIVDARIGQVESSSEYQTLKGYQINLMANGYHTIQNNLKKFMGMIEQIYSKLESLTENLVNKKEEDD